MPLKSKQVGKRIHRPDWFPVKSYLHFDGQISKRNAEKLVSNPDEVARHSFLPLITFTKSERRFRRTKTGSVVKLPKRRKLAYSSNRDSCILAYYSYLLTEPYERALAARGLGDVVIGYRKVGSNIELAMNAFAGIKAFDHCTALAFDVSTFFDTINHAQLKKCWQEVLGCERLPDDHFAVFKAITKFSMVDRRACLRRLGKPVAARDRDLGQPPLCPIEVYRNRIRGDDGKETNLVLPWLKNHRIPQGTPISAIAANISMLEFDTVVNRHVGNLGGFYRRYSDDILVVVPTSQRTRATSLVQQALYSKAGRLRMNRGKTTEVDFVSGSLAGVLKPLQYLGLTFDGEDVLIRSSTMSRYWRRVHRTVNWVRRQHKKAQADEIPGRDVVHRRELHARMTHLGKDTFISGYVKRAAKITGSRAIKRQVRRHTSKIARLVEVERFTE